MGFKNINTEKASINFINNARGDKINTQKRDKKILVSFTQDEYDRMKESALQIGMGVNQYIRYKLFI
ncbi:TPA: hypothetical protein R4631_001684 [Campylobacter jejuni]|uniref:plasmid mobilization protein n=1 Tax=Campylobacter TaxID=194 RepID=UPI00069A9362|nr:MULTISPECIES: hypothetical protein [Campylobacter]EAI4695525.1 hypothetical protein [Campylobacter jejuni]EAK8086909.1 hypothetical protein [Campylobacter jejuni]EAK8355878.1 hypothetical protein [Campylobacter jejuni]EAK8592920.1 hypothetical protein [Campylobacter jejuni]EAL0376841.1 hypothetical protein [Campylobacter jejuni]